MVRVGRCALVGLLIGVSPAFGGTAVSCGGFAMLGGAQLNCSHTDPMAAMQVCTFNWTLLSANSPSVVSGSFLLPPGASNTTVYQGAGFSGMASNPIVLCQGRSG